MLTKYSSGVILNSERNKKQAQKKRGKTMKNWIVIENIEDACGFDSIEIASFETEEEAVAKIKELESEEIKEYGEVIGEYTYYNVME